MASAAPIAPAGARLSWLDGMKGISILWIAFFHFFGTYANGRYLNVLGPHYFSSFVSQCAPSSALGTLEGCWHMSAHSRTVSTCCTNRM